MEDDKLPVAMLEQEGEAGGWWVPRPVPAPPPPPKDGGLDARHRRGSIGPPPMAAPLDEAAPGVALHAHLMHLIEARGDAVAPPYTTPAASSHRLRDDLHDDLREDLERQPDGVPHLVIGLTAFISVVLAAVLISLLLSGPTLGGTTAAVLALVAVPFVVFRLGAKAERDRDHDHPSR